MGVFDETLGADELRVFFELHRELRPLVGNTTTTISVLTGQFQMRMDPEVRRLGGDMTREFGPSAVCAATVVRADGIVASFARSVITGMMLLGRSTTPHRVFQRVDDALDWTLGHVAQPPRVQAEAKLIREAVLAVNS